MTKEYIHPDCSHSCTSNCRREGCNCECGEWCGRMTPEEYREAMEQIKEDKISEIANKIEIVIRPEYHGTLKSLADLIYRIAQ